MDDFDTIDAIDVDAFDAIDSIAKDAISCLKFVFELFAWYGAYETFVYRLSIVDILAEAFVHAHSILCRNVFEPAVRVVKHYCAVSYPDRSTKFDVG
jgi:hypothetical protein